MTSWKIGLGALVLSAGFAASTQAQGFVGGYPGFGVGGVGGGYGYSSGFSSYGQPGFAGNSSSGYGPGLPFNNYYARTSVPYVGPQTGNNLGGLMNSIRQQTGRPGSYSYGSNYGVARRRRAR